MRHRGQCDKGAYIVICRRNELAADLLELIDHRSRLRAAWQWGATQNEQVAKFQRRVDPRGGHRGLQARLKGPRIRVFEKAEAIVLLATSSLRKVNDKQPCSAGRF